MIPSISTSNTHPNFRLAVSENIEEAVSGKLMTRAVTLFPCGHIFNEETVISCLARSKLCPLDSQLIVRHTPNYTIRLQAKIAEADFLSEFFRERYIALLGHLLNEPSIKGIPSLANLLENQSKILMSQFGEPLTEEEKINYSWTRDLLDENKKIRQFVFNRLQQTHPSAPLPEGVSLSPLSTSSPAGVPKEIGCYSHRFVPLPPLPSAALLYNVILQVHFPEGNGEFIKQTRIIDRIYKIDSYLSTEEKVLYIFQKLFTLASSLSPLSLEENIIENKASNLFNYSSYLLNISCLLLWHHLPGGREYLSHPYIYTLPLKRKAELLIPWMKEYCVQLNRLNLSHLNFIFLPPAIGQLSQLQRLYLHNNQLTTLPAAIGQLSQLQRLCLHNNQLTSLPETIGQLSQLQRLYLHNNQLTTLPESIGQLSQLQYLFLSNNKLRALPESIGQLSQLKHLYLV
jgi:Leucine-rich repeat (LRR) protein